MTAESDRQRALLRQLRDLDDDRAAGKITDADHRRLRTPLEVAAAESLHPSRPATADPTRGAAKTTAPGAEGTVASGDTGVAASEGGETGVPGGRSGGRGKPGVRRRRRVVAVLAAAAAVASVGVLLAGAIAPRGAGGTVSGDAPAAAATASPGAPAGGSADRPADPPATSRPAGPAQPGGDPAGPAGQTVGAEQVAAIDTAALDVKAHPKDVGKHLTLAHAYADGGEGQLAAVEYLAILRLDPGNAEANTALALLAFEVGQPQQAKDMLDRVLAADPAYAEALYVRGLVLLSGLHQPAAATRDLHAYLTAAPYGSHRTAAETLLALAGSPP